MKLEDGATQSIWSDVRTTVTNSAPFDAEVIVVGGGIAGLTTAYLLAGEGRSVLVVDEGDVGRGQTERTSAHVSNVLDARFATVAKERGDEAARLAWQSHGRAIDLIERISKDEKIDCDFARVDGYLFDGDPPTDATLDDELTTCRRIGFPVIDDTRSPAGTTIGRAIRFGGQARFHPTRYVAGLANAAEKRGVKFALGRRAKDARGRTKDAPPTVTLSDDTKLVASKAVVVCCCGISPMNDWSSISYEQFGYRTYMVGHAVPAGSIEDALYWDAHDPYHYARLTEHAGQTVLLVGGEDHKTGQGEATGERFAALSAWTRKVFPAAGEEVSRWSGQVFETSDGLGVIGRAPTDKADEYVITGDSGMGLTHGTLGAELIADLIAGRPNPYVELYDPARRLMNREAIREDANAALQYADYVTPGDIKSPDDLSPGQGGVLRIGLSKVAVYKDEHGVIHTCSAVCTHKKALLRWNGVEKSWDCPAHGSRFSCTGAVLQGPAVQDLAEM